MKEFSWKLVAKGLLCLSLDFLRHRILRGPTVESGSPDGLYGFLSVVSFCTSCCKKSSSYLALYSPATTTELLEVTRHFLSLWFAPVLGKRDSQGIGSSGNSWGFTAIAAFFLFAFLPPSKVFDH